MGKLRFTAQADNDLDGITGYSVQTWGSARTARYLADLEQCCLRIADNPLLGRSCDRILAGLRRIEQGSHVIFYMAEDREVLIVRILHRKMLPERWIGEDEPGSR